MNKKAIYAGTFDPLTNGHLDLLTRSAQIFDWIILAIAASPSKCPLFSLYERVTLASQVTTHLKNVQVIGFSDLITDLAIKEQANILIRGVRMKTDLEYEIQLSKINRHFMPKLETLFMISAEHYSFISSSLVKEVALHGGNIDYFLPFPIAKEVNARLRNILKKER